MVDEVKSYKNFADFKKRVLDKAQEEINELTDLNIYFEPILKGRKTVKVKFRIEQKDAIQRLIAGSTANDRLGELE
jgi:plasmid replication initiation protein